MVAPRPADASESRAQILAAASRLFAARGFEATSLQAIADELGVTKQAVLHHFRSKDQLRQAVLDDMVAHFREAVPRLLFAATASEDRFDAVFGELFHFFAQAPDRARLLVREALDRPAEVKKVLRGPVRPWVDAVASYIRQGQASGRHYADVDPEAYVSLITLFVVSAAASAQVSQATMPTAATADGGDVRGRWDGELHRIAKSALFTPSPRATPTPASKPKPRTKSAKQPR